MSDSMSITLPNPAASSLCAAGNSSPVETTSTPGLALYCRSDAASEVRDPFRRNPGRSPNAPAGSASDAIPAPIPACVAILPGDAWQAATAEPSPAVAATHRPWSMFAARHREAWRAI